MDREQLLLPVEGIDRIHESPQLEMCREAKDNWERFMMHHFSIEPDDYAYKKLFPYLNDLDIETLQRDRIEALTDFLTEAEAQLRLYINMCREWDHYNEAEQLGALMHWVDWCDIFPDREEMVDETIQRNKSNDA